MINLDNEYNPEKSVFIIDGHSMIYRAYFALINRPLINSKGFNTSAIFGFMRILLKLIKRFKPQYLIISFDKGKPVFRHKIFSEYKATRPKMPDDMRAQIPEIKNMLKLYGIPQIEADGFEADDIIAQLSIKFEKKEKNVYIVTRDKDLSQVVTDRIKVLQPEHKQSAEDFTLMDKKAVKKKYGFPAENIADYLSLTGDASDNIPGVKGIGPKTAQKLIKEFKTLISLYDNIDKMQEDKVKEKLLHNKDNAFLSYELIKLNHEVPLDLSFEDCKIQQPDKEKVTKLLEKFEIKSLLKDLNWLEEQSKKTDYKIVDTEDKLKKLAAELKKVKLFSFDTETDSQFPIRASLVGLSFSFEEFSAYYIPVGHADLLYANQVSMDLIKKYIKPILESSESSIIGQNLKYDYLVMKNYDIHLNNIFFDTMVASYLLNPTKIRHNLDTLAANFLGYNMTTFKEVVGKLKDFSEVAIEKACEYSCEDADITLRLHNILVKKIKDIKIESLFEKIDIPLIKVLAEMEASGVKIDPDKLNKLNKTISSKLTGLTAQIHKEAEEVFNINSTKQLAHILFEKLGLPAGKKGKTGYSTDIDVLKDLQNSHSIVAPLIEYRKLNKLENTYIEALPKMINPETKRIHTSFSQTTTATGRLSSSDPNLQNIPIRDEFGKKIREAFIPEKGSLLLSADYSQIELRILAHIAEDELLIDAFKKDQDIHSRTCMELYNIPEDKVTPELRRIAKIINFGIIYGMSAFGLSKELNIEMYQANEFIENYFNKYKGIKKYIEKTKNDIKTKSYVENIFGRKRYLPNMSRYSKQQTAFVLRAATNTPIQGTSADLIKIAMIDIHNEFTAKKIRSKMILQVHDELIFEVIPEEKDMVQKIASEKMENVYEFKVPIKVDINFGKNWGEAH